MTRGIQYEAEMDKSATDSGMRVTLRSICVSETVVERLPCSELFSGKNILLSCEP